MHQRFIRLFLSAALLTAAPAFAQQAEALGVRAAEAYDSGDVALAAMLFRQSARAGSVDAMTIYAGMRADGLGVTANPKDAARWYARAARRGDSHAMVMLAETYLAADPVDPRARDLYREAAARGHEFARRRLGQPPAASDAKKQGVTGETE